MFVGVKGRGSAVNQSWWKIWTKRWVQSISTGDDALKKALIATEIGVGRDENINAIMGRIEYSTKIEKRSVYRVVRDEYVRRGERTGRRLLRDWVWRALG